MLNRSRRALIATAAVGLIAGLSGCGGTKTDATADTATDNKPAAKPAAEVKVEDRCESVGKGLRAKFAPGGALNDGVTPSGIAAVRSKDFKEVWFVAVGLAGEGMNPKKDVAVFATNSLEADGLLFGVGGFAHQFSGMGHGEKTDAKFSISDDGYDEAQDCLKA